MSRSLAPVREPAKELSSLPVLDASVRRLRGVVHTLQDTLDRAALGNTVAGTNLLDSLPAAVLLIDNTGHIAACNQVARQLLGSRLQGRAWSLVISDSLVASDGGTQLALPDGRRLSVATQALRGGGGQVVLLNDVTETWSLQRRLRQRSRLAEMGEMMARLAHQLGQPLATAALYIGELGKAVEHAPRASDLAHRIEHSLDVLRDQIRDMQMFTSNARVGNDVISAATLLRQLSDLVAPTFAQAAALLEIRTGELAGSVRGNAVALSSVLSNLAQNALQARPDGLVLRLDVYADDDSLAIDFRDNGPGITPDIAAHVFDPFFTTRAGGTGLGMAIARTVIEAHGGSIECEPNATGGFVRVRLPLAGGEA